VWADTFIAHAYSHLITAVSFYLLPGLLHIATALASTNSGDRQNGFGDALQQHLRAVAA